MIFWKLTRSTFRWYVRIPQFGSGIIQTVRLLTPTGCSCEGGEPATEVSSRGTQSSGRDRTMHWHYSYNTALLCCIFKLTYVSAVHTPPTLTPHTYHNPPPTHTHTHSTYTHSTCTHPHTPHTPTQVSTYNEDFQSERVDRERAQESITKLKDTNETLHQFIRMMVYIPTLHVT